MSSAATGLKRSLLYAPAINARALDKALELPTESSRSTMTTSAGSSRAFSRARALIAGA